MPNDPNDPLTDTPPLDIASMLPPPPQQQAPAAPPSGNGGNKNKGWMLNAALAALMPVAAKRGGPMAVAGLLHGIQRAQAESQAQAQQQFQNNRLTQGDQRAQEALDQTRWNQQQTVAGSILREASGALAGVESPDAVGPLLALYKQRLANAGFRDTGVLDRYAQSIAAPDKILRRKVEKVIAKTKPEVLDAYVQSRASLKTDDGQVLPFDVWSQHLASGVDPQTGKPIITVAPPPKPEPTQRPTSLEQQYLDAIEAGDTAKANRIRQAANIRDNPQASGGMFSPSKGAEADDDVKKTVDGIISGRQPPTLQGFYGNTLKVRAELERRGYDFTNANLDYQATQQHWKTLNGAQQTRMRQAVDNASHSLDVIEELAGEWKGGKFPILNRGRLSAARGGALGPEAQRIATALEAQIADVTSELANVYMGGNSPTDHAMELAAKNLQANWSESQLKALIGQQRRNLQIRMNSIRNASAITPSSQTAAPPAPPLTKDAQIGQVYTYNGKKVRVREKTRTGFLFDEVP